ncbi:hypothetical protein D8674_031225 [Pyrus ussuriensis x Pyrus communis]|uniref:Uncharacterized protein n=1 Tax=Pyrus ussuriensis x Pyrus communis TaxID=2448454 RepID=A0A5N5EYH0_9ROSA|nr:hypothetical protein D8674_031225 [Pyrus ussuriensis x Pyrus communis]
MLLTANLFAYESYKLKIYFLSSCWSRTWGEEHFGNGKVHKYGKSTTGESWDIVVDEETYYEAELSIKPRERPPGVYPALDFGSSSLSVDEPPDEFSLISCGSKNFVCVYVCFCALNNSNQIPLLLS